VAITHRPRAVLFDLDGTLLDTAPDFLLALNALRAEETLAPLVAAEIRHHVSQGSAALICAAFNTSAERPDFERRRLRLLELYAQVLGQATLPFAGVEDVLLALEARGLPWGIVTNKPGWLTTPLLAALGLDQRAGCVISGDSTPHAKPHPEPLLVAASTLDVLPADCLYVGDAERDVEAARAAGMTVLVALYGYIGIDEHPERWGGDGSIACARDLLAWI
jgi:N-acetyl-D-muramate 6-phosphate phosphatase